VRGADPRVRFLGTDKGQDARQSAWMLDTLLSDEIRRATELSSHGSGRREHAWTANGPRGFRFGIFSSDTRRRRLRIPRRLCDKKYRASWAFT